MLEKIIRDCSQDVVYGVGFVYNLLASRCCNSFKFVEVMTAVRPSAKLVLVLKRVFGAPLRGGWVDRENKKKQHNKSKLHSRENAPCREA